MKTTLEELARAIRVAQVQRADRAAKQAKKARAEAALRTLWSREVGEWPADPEAYAKLRGWECIYGELPLRRAVQKAAGMDGLDDSDEVLTAVGLILKVWVASGFIEDGTRKKE